MAGIDRTMSSLSSLAAVMAHPLDTMAGVAGAVVGPGAMARDGLKISAEAAFEQVGAKLATYPGGFACATTLHGTATPQQLLDGLLSDWSKWWAPGQVKNFERTAEGGAKFMFQPLSTMGVGLMDVGVELHAPKFLKTAAGEDLIRVPLSLSHDLKGKGFFEFKGRPGGGSVMKSIWQDAKLGGLKQYVPGMSEVIGRAHLAVEDLYLKCLDNFSKNLKRAIR